MALTIKEVNKLIWEIDKLNEKLDSVKENPTDVNFVLNTIDNLITNAIIKECVLSLNYTENEKQEFTNKEK